MAVVSAVVPYVSTAVAVAGFVVSEKRAEAEKEEQGVLKKEAQVRRRRQRQKSLAEAAKRKAELTAQASQAGVGGGTTAVQQAGGALQSQLSSNLGFLSQLEGLENQASAAQEKQAKAASQQAAIQAAGVVGQSAGKLFSTGES